MLKERNNLYLAKKELEAVNQFIENQPNPLKLNGFKKVFLYLFEKAKISNIDSDTLQLQELNLKLEQEVKQLELSNEILDADTLILQELNVKLEKELRAALEKRKAPPTPKPPTTPKIENPTPTPTPSPTVPTPQKKQGFTIY